MTLRRHVRAALAVALLAATVPTIGSGISSAATGAEVPGLPTVRSGPLPGPAILYAPPPRAPQLENVKPWQAEPILISGASAYRNGEFVYQDWIYDDRGAAGVPDPADPHGPRNHLFSPKAGTLTYPTDPRYGGNAADIVEVRVRPGKCESVLRVTFNTLLDAERTAFTAAIGDSPEARAWPHGAGVSSPAALFLTVHGATAELVDAVSGAIVSPAPTASVDLERRQVDVRIPHEAWNPGNQIVRLAIGAGLWDASSGGYLVPGASATGTTPGGVAPGGAALFNVAFRPDEPLPEVTALSGRTMADAAALSRVQARWWNERAQADALAAGDISEFSALVDFGKLAAKVTDESAVPVNGYMNRILASRFFFGQGVDYSRSCGGIDTSGTECEGALVGQLQPYAVYIPDKPVPANGYGLTLLLHALSANHNQYLGSRHAAQLGDRGPGSIVVTPSGRGPDGFYRDVAEADVFEVWADIARRYRLDPQWVATTGISMGGIGSWRLAGRYPDLFGAMMPVVAAAGTAGNDELMPSLRHVPVMMWSATLDELQNVAQTEATTQRMIELGLRFDAWRFETWDHLTPSTNDYYLPGAQFLGTRKVDRNPPRVTYVVAPGKDSARAGVVADHAYWLSGLRVRDESVGTGEIDVVSEAFGVGTPVVLPVQQSVGVLTGGNHEPAPYTRRVRTWGPAPLRPVADRLLVTARNVAAVTVDPRRARLTCDAEVLIDSDGPLTVTLAGCDRLVTRG